MIVPIGSRKSMRTAAMATRLSIGSTEPIDRKMSISGTLSATFHSRHSNPILATKRSCRKCACRCYRRRMLRANRRTSKLTVGH